VLPEAVDGNLAFTVSELMPITRGQLVVFLTLRNIGKSAQPYDAGYQTLIDTDGREFSVDMHLMMTASANNPLFVIRTDINPGDDLKAALSFNVPNDMKPVKLVFHESMYSHGAVVNLT
jgi:hypothetical protein